MHHHHFENAANLMLLGQVLLGLWITAFGSCAGSFLNVVIYRWPAGLSVINPGSRCPHCRHHVRWYDNIPILNWFWLRGRCRDCHTPIPFRYPAVEIVIASIFLGLYLLYVIFLGRNLPMGWYMRSYDELMYQLIRLLGYQATFFTLCVASTLIRYDGHPVPIKLVLFALLFGFALPVAYPHLHVVPIGLHFRHHAQVIGALESGAGLVAGFLMGVVNSPFALRRFGPDWFRRSCVFESAIGGLFFGWQASLVIGVWTLAWSIPHAIVNNHWGFATRVPKAVWIPIGYLVYLLLWRPLCVALPILAGGW